MKRRTIRPNTRSFTGRHACPQAGVVRYESALERDAITLLRSRHPISIVEQPFTYEFLDSTGCRRRYTPDFQVDFRIGQRVVYEVKYRHQLRQRWAEYREVLWAMRNHLAGTARFRFLTELSIRTPRLQNLRLLTPHQLATPDPRFADAVLALAALSPISIGDAVKSLCRSQEDRAAFYSALWPLVAQGTLAVDLSKPLGMQTRLEVPDGR